MKPIPALCQKTVTELCALLGREVSLARITDGITRLEAAQESHS